MLGIYAVLLGWQQFEMHRSPFLQDPTIEAKPGDRIDSDITEMI